MHEKKTKKQEKFESYKKNLFYNNYTHFLIIPILNLIPVSH